MKFVIQRVTEGSVTVEEKTVGAIKRGYVVLIGVGQNDSQQEANRLIKKMLGLRIFPDENGKINLSLADVGGSLLLISQFTLYANCRKGNRPSFVDAGDPAKAEALYEYIIDSCRRQVPVVEKGVFGAKMQVHLCNDGPFTVILDSDVI